MATAESHPGFFERLKDEIYSNVFLGLTCGLRREMCELNKGFGQVKKGEVKDPGQIETLGERQQEWLKKVVDHSKV